MNSIRHSILIGMTVFGLGSAALPALAHESHEGRHGAAASAEQRQAKRAERHAARQQALREALKLSPAQEGAWASYAAARQPQTRADGQRPDRAAWKALPAPLRMEQQIARSRQRTAAMEARLATLNSFYAVLTSEQKKVFDARAMQRGGGRHHDMRHGRHA